jgi:hypothetical protein
MSVVWTAAAAHSRSLCVQNPSRWNRHVLSIASRSFSNSNESKKSDTYRFEDANPERIQGIQVNPDSLGSEILPGNLVYKKYKWSGTTRKIPVELSKNGYFWMMHDLRNTNNKPTLSNENIIPETAAQLFPVLNGLKTLANQKADLPFFFIDGDGTTV